MLSALAALAVTAGMAAGAKVPPTITSSIAFSGAPGTGAPPATLGGFSMTPFPLDAQGTPVTSVPSPLGGDVLFGTLAQPQTLDHTTVGAGWATWSHGYTGDVYPDFTPGGVNAANDVDYYLTLTLPAGTNAFYFYVEPNSFSTFAVSATAIGSNRSKASGSAQVTGLAGARFFGFYSTSGETITTIVVKVVAAAGGFGIGEFGINGGVDED
jgi:hypothetical protein